MIVGLIYAVVFGYYTYRGSGIHADSDDGLDGAPGSEGAATELEKRVGGSSRRCQAGGWHAQTQGSEAQRRRRRPQRRYDRPAPSAQNMFSTRSSPTESAR
ncbi:MAG: hypothetical protein M3022_01590 [Actinomycetota bacterium]|nr:hypothetical protein [Actinomycetota bacterium]